MIQLTDERYWLFAAVDPATNEFLHVRLFPTRNMAVTEMFLAELSEKHDVNDAVFLVHSEPWLHAALHRRCLRFRYERHGNRNAVERVFQEIKRRTYRFGNLTGGCISADRRGGPVTSRCKNIVLVLSHND